MKNPSKCTEAIPCSGNPEDEEYFCAYGSLEDYKHMCVSEECTQLVKELRLQGNFPRDKCLATIPEEHPEDCYVTCICPS